MNIRMKLLAAAMLAGIAGMTAAAEEAPAMDEQGKLGYALGMAQGSAMREYKVELDQVLYEQGFRDALAGKETRLTEAESQAIVANLQNDLRKLAKDRIANQNLKAGAAFLTANKTQDGVVTLNSGLQYKILKAGEGKKPGPDDRVSVNYRGALINGSEFANSQKPRNKPVTISMEKVIPGWREALQLMPTGSKWQIFIPPELAYGERTSGRQIGPNSTLIFVLELLAINEPKQINESDNPQTLSMNAGEQP